MPPEDTIKVTLDFSDDGPVFSALDEMMMKMIDDDASDRKTKKGAGGGGGKGGDAKKCLKNLLKSGIPGIEGMFAGPPEPPKMNKKTGKLETKKQKGFHKMTEGSKG